MTAHDQQAEHSLPVLRTVWTVLGGVIDRVAGLEGIRHAVADDLASSPVDPAGPWLSLVSTGAVQAARHGGAATGGNGFAPQDRPEA